MKITIQKGRLVVPKGCVAYVNGKRRRRWPKPRIKTGVSYHIAIAVRDGYSDEVMQDEPLGYWY